MQDDSGAARRGGGLARWAVALATGLAGVGCVTEQSVEPVSRRPEFAALRTQVRGKPVGLLQVAVEQAGSLPAPSGSTDIRAVSVAPDRNYTERVLVDAIDALGLFDRVGAERPIEMRDRIPFRLIVRPARSNVEWVGMTSGAWANFLLWGVVGPASWLVADETFAGYVEWDVRLESIDGDEVLATTRIAQRTEVSLNDFDRGFSFWDLLAFACAPIDEARLQIAGPKVLWFTEADAAFQLCEWLVEDAAATLPDEVPVDPEDPEDPTPTPVDPVPPPPTPVPVPTVDKPRWRVLCVGVERYAADPVAPGAKDDAIALARALTSRLDGQDATVTTLVDAQATSAAVSAWLRALAAEKLGDDDHVWVAFAGRGTTDSSGQPHLVLHDGRMDAAGASGTLALRDVARACVSAGECTLLLDCAFQGRLDERGPDRDRPPVAVDRVWPSNVRALGASWADGEATQHETGYGLFTRLLLDVLNDRRGGDANGDGRVTLAEIESQVGPRGRELARAAGVYESPARLSGAPAAAFLPNN